MEVNLRRVFDVVMGRGLLHGVESDETAAAGFRLRCGAVWLLSNG